MKFSSVMKIITTISSVYSSFFNYIINPSISARSDCFGRFPRKKLVCLEDGTRVPFFFQCVI